MLKTIQVLLTLATLHNWKINHIDVKTAFLNPLLNEIVYITQSESFEFDDHVCYLRKALYGLKEAPRAWYQDIDKFLKSLGFTNSMTDPNLYISQDIILILYVDDMLITAKDKIALAKFKKQMTQKYEMTDLGEAQQFLGLQIHRNRERKMLFIHQSQYI